MKTYYKTINGIHYDKAMLEVADESVSRKRDSRISMNDAKKIINKASDAGMITEVEARTLNYIYEHYKFTPSADEYFSNFAFLEKGDNQPSGDEVQVIDDDIFGIKEFFAKYYLLIILVGLILFMLYLYSDKLISMFSKGAEFKGAADTQQISTGTQDISVKTSAEVVTAGENEYIIKEKDTLFDISSRLYGDPGKWQDLYERNKDIIEKPSMIYPGQKIRTDLK